ncbi:MAG: FliO/MopB family protein [Candidatus Riflebacteria bacterium]|nr:FliO/MopB family protein [Candidatus Riflebacteria bacterium]
MTLLLSLFNQIVFLKRFKKPLDRAFAAVIRGNINRPNFLKKLGFFILCIIFIFYSNGPLPASSASESSFLDTEVSTSSVRQIQKIPENDPLSISVNLFISFAMILAILFFISWYLQKKGGFKSSIYGKTIGVIPLDHKRFIYIVDILGKMMVLGVTDHQINFLCEITEKTTVDALRMKSQENSSNSLDRIFSFLKKTKNSSDDVEKMITEPNAGQKYSSIIKHTVSARKHIDEIRKNKIQSEPEPEFEPELGPELELENEPEPEPEPESESDYHSGSKFEKR